MQKYSLLEIYDLKTQSHQTIRTIEGIAEAPNWLSDGNTLLYNQDGHIFRYDMLTDTISQVDTGVCDQCNNDHVSSPDNQYLAVSNSFGNAESWGSHIYILPMSGGPARQVTQKSPSFLHGWSKDGALVYCAFRGGSTPQNAHIDIYTIPVGGGEEQCLTDGQGYNDGPEYSPDGNHIWFNSTRAGLMHIFRMDRDGTHLTQMTDGDQNDWFPHVSPDGQKVVYLSFRKEDLEPWQHLPDKEVTLTLMNADGSNKQTILTLFGGQGTINVNSWSPDSAKFAYFRYAYRNDETST